MKFEPISKFPDLNSGTRKILKHSLAAQSFCAMKGALAVLIKEAGPREQEKRTC
jgi:hypothetical protein